MPAACSIAVATTKPAPKRSAAASPNSPPWAWPWNRAKRPTSAAQARRSTRTAIATTSPRITVEARIIGSTAGRGRPPSARTNPTAIVPTKAAGTIQSARPPSSPAQRPTATMARM
mgnify:CR=1 FL=1